MSKEEHGVVHLINALMLKLMAARLKLGTCHGLAVLAKPSKGC